jgi:multidrug efflux pump
VVPKGFPPGYRRINGGSADQSILHRHEGQADPDREDRGTDPPSIRWWPSPAAAARGGLLFARWPRGERRPPTGDPAHAPKLARGGSACSSTRCRICGRAADQRHLSICAARRQAPSLRSAGDKLVKALKAQPAAITDVDIDQQDAGASAFVTVDRDRAARLGIAMNTIDNALRRLRPAGGLDLSGLNQYHVVMEADPPIPASPRR